MYYDNLNLNELQFSRLVPPYYGQYSLQPTPTDLSLNADTLFPDLNNIPQFPAPFSMDPTNRSAYTVQWNANVQRSLGRSYLVEVAYTGSRSYNEHKRYNINQAETRDHADRHTRAVPGVPVRDSLFVRRRLGPLQRPLLPRGEALLGRPLLPRQLPDLEEHRQRVG